MSTNLQLDTCCLPIIHTAGRSIFDPMWAEREHTDPCSELLFVLQGQVTIKTSSYSIVGREGDTIYTPKNVPHRDIFPLGSIFEVYLIQFRWAEEQEWLKNRTPVQLAKAAKACRRHLAEDFIRLFQDLASHQEPSHVLAQLRLLEILYQLTRQADVQSTPARQEEARSQLRRHQIMQQARAIILEHFDRQISLETIAEKLDISPYYLSRIFSEESGFTLCHYLTQVRMEKAAELLRDGQRKISEIAFRTGFKDDHYFSRVFKAHFGCSPKQYRARPIPSRFVPHEHK